MNALTRSPALYFPIDRGLYEVAAGMRPLGTVYRPENGEFESKVIQFDRTFPEHRKGKLASRAENLDKYHGIDGLPSDVAAAATLEIVRRLVLEEPEHFQWSETERRLHCQLTGENLFFSESMELDSKSDAPPVGPRYQNAIDALISQVPDDFSLVLAHGERGHMAVMHVCSPSHWDPRSKLATDFISLHAPVPHFDKLAKASRQILDAIVTKGPFVRFVWSFVTDLRLNHHPEPPPGWDHAAWKGRSFDSTQKNPFYLRVERQVTVPLPAVRASLFFIRLSFISGTEIRDNEVWRNQLVSALKSMSPESRSYKGVAHCFDELLTWLTQFKFQGTNVEI